MSGVIGMTETTLYVRLYIDGNTYTNPIDIQVDSYDRSTVRGIKQLLNSLGYDMTYEKLNTYIIGDYETNYRVYKVVKK